jgi:hypothetical protein
VDRSNAIEEEIRATNPDTVEGLVTKLRHFAWTKIGSDYADRPLEDRDWNEQAQLIALADAERLAG